jgi:uncharacterized protein YndB with AHSA1/START domain
MATIKHLFHINASKQTVYEALTTINGLSNWWTNQTTGDSKIDGIIQFRFTGGGCDMRVITLEESKTVQWFCVDGWADWIGTTISFQLEEANGKTKVLFQHSDWEDENEFFAGCSFSWGRFMESLRQFCQTGEGESFGSKNYRQ